MGARVQRSERRWRGVNEERGMWREGNFYMLASVRKHFVCLLPFVNEEKNHLVFGLVIEVNTSYLRSDGFVLVLYVKLRMMVIPSEASPSLHANAACLVWLSYL